MATVLNTLKQKLIEARSAHNELLDKQVAAKGALADALTAQVGGKDGGDASALEAAAKGLDGQVATSRRLITTLEEQLHAQEQREAAEIAAVGSGGHRIETHDNREDRPWAKGKMGLGEWGIACMRAVSGKGVDPRLFKAAATGMGEAIGADGGFAVPLEQATEIEAAMFETGQILSLVDAREILGNRMVYNLIRNEVSRANGSRYGGVQGYWVDEGTAPTASTFKMARLELTLRKVGAYGFMSDELMEDAAALGGELQQAFTEELIFQVEDAIWEGTGAGKPLGFTIAPCWVAVTIEGGQTLANGPILVQNLSHIWARMPPRQKPNSVWCVGSDMMVALDSIALPVGTAALEPRFVSYDQNGVLRIKGRPVIEVEYASVLGTIGDIALCNFRQYRLIRKAGGVQQASSIHVHFAQGETAFRAFYRCDGQPVPRGTVAEFKGPNARTPFVGLGTRA